MATNATLNELLLPQVIVKVVSRIRQGQGDIGRWLGFQPDRVNEESGVLAGPNTLTNSAFGTARNVTYRIFDRSRVVPKGRAPGTGPATVSQNPIGYVPISVARFHEKINLNYEQLGNLSGVAGPNSQIDVGGADYIRRQTGFLAGQVNMMIEMMAAAMMRDSLYFIIVGDNWFPQFTPPTGTQIGFQVSFQIPAGNKNQLNMLGNGNIVITPWSNPGAPMMTDLAGIGAAFVQLSGYALSDIWVNSISWQNVLLNQQIRNVGGSSNTVFNEYIREPATFPDGLPSTHFVGVLRALPWLRWHIDDDVVALNTDIDPSYGTAPAGATLAKLIPDNLAIFTTQASRDIAEMYHGGEWVIENAGMPAVQRMGYHFWHEYTTQPAQLELIGVFNGIPFLYIPKCFAPGQVFSF
jgi:hypothetical protein